MANLLDKYGIKEVADVVFYTQDASTGAINWSNPVLYLDTLKVSTIEQTAENVSARGGKGNPELVTWDYNKEITLTLEDALFSAKSLAFMFGTTPDSGSVGTVTQMISPSELEKSGSKYYWKLPGVREEEQAYKEITAPVFYNANGSTVAATGVSYDKSNGWTMTVADGSTATTYPIVGVLISYTPSSGTEIKIDSDRFPGQYAIVGDTFARPQGSTLDEMFQFIIYNAKVNSEVTLTLEAEGDPTTFNMSVKVLKPKTGKTMMKLIKYGVNGAKKSA